MVSDYNGWKNERSSKWGDRWWRLWCAATTAATITTDGVHTHFFVFVMVAWTKRHLQNIKALVKEFYGISVGWVCVCVCLWRRNKNKRPLATSERKRMNTINNHLNIFAAIIAVWRVFFFHYTVRNIVVIPDRCYFFFLNRWPPFRINKGKSALILSICVYAVDVCALLPVAPKSFHFCVFFLLFFMKLTCLPCADVVCRMLLLRVLIFFSSLSPHSFASSTTKLSMTIFNATLFTSQYDLIFFLSHFYCVSLFVCWCYVFLKCVLMQ